MSNPLKTQTTMDGAQKKLSPAEKQRIDEFNSVVAQLGWSQVDVARELVVTRSWINQIAHGIKAPSEGLLKFLKLIARYQDKVGGQELSRISGLIDDLPTSSRAPALEAVAVVLTAFPRDPQAPAIEESRRPSRNANFRAHATRTS